MENIKLHHDNSLLSPLISENSTIYAYILNDIANGLFVSGDRLVTTRLAKKYHTSINPVREALKQLQGEGFVTISPNSGARVAVFEYETLRNVFEILQLLEPYLISWFVEEHEDTDIEHLVNITDKMEKAQDKEFRHLDTQFHWHTFKQHYNQRAINLWRKNRLILLAMQSSVNLNKNRMAQSVSEHRELIESLKSRELSTVLAVMQKHIENSGQYLTTYLTRKRQFTF